MLGALVSPSRTCAAQAHQRLWEEPLRMRQQRCCPGPCRRGKGWAGAGRWGAPVMTAPTEPSTVSGGPTSRIVALFLLMSRRSGDTISCGAPRASGGARMHTRAHALIAWATSDHNDCNTSWDAIMPTLSGDTSPYQSTHPLNIILALVVVPCVAPGATPSACPPRATPTATPSTARRSVAAPGAHRRRVRAGRALPGRARRLSATMQRGPHQAEVATLYVGDLALLGRAASAGQEALSPLQSVRGPTRRSSSAETPRR